ncbi:MAG: DUF3575 domain-containing protein, partial [Muribaculaceae bacterium]|nr:DUF3575 domain-containing protein [Muribaculaceae bacterium]
KVFSQVAVKTNLLYDVLTTPNLGVDVGLGGKSSINVVYGLNAWKFRSSDRVDKFAKHWVVMPEYRWWPCSRFNGHFIGAHLLGGEMNISNFRAFVPGCFVSGINLATAVKDGRYQGEFVGAGFTYGYAWPISKHWNFEATLGAGYVWVHYKHYPCGECGSMIDDGNTNYIGLTKIGLSLSYLF